MSKEAKIGLLLGLVFIAGIALVLRGIHPSEAELMDEDLSISEPMQESGARGGVVCEQVDFSSAVEELSDPWAGRSSPVERPAAVVEVAQGQEEEWETWDGGTRYEQELPSGSAVRPMEQPARGVAAQKAAAGAVVVEAPVQTALEAALEEIARRVTPAESEMREVRFEYEGPGTGSAAPVAGRMPTYVVEKGDDLSRIAKRVYGPEAGNRWVNVKRIYEANRDVLASMDMVRQGQELRIPLLEGETAVTASQPASQTTQTRPVASRTYVVRKDDTLWEIAERELGSGVRYHEIVKASGLKDENTLWVGMELKLPAR